MGANVFGDALAAAKARDDQVIGVVSIGRRTRRTPRRPSVAAGRQQEAGRLVGSPVEVQDLTGRRVHSDSLTLEPDGFGAAAGCVHHLPSADEVRHGRSLGRCEEVGGEVGKVVHAALRSSADREVSAGCPATTSTPKTRATRRHLSCCQRGDRAAWRLPHSWACARWSLFRCNYSEVLCSDSRLPW